jgi:hypothetical protein
MGPYCLECEEIKAAEGLAAIPDGTPVYLNQPLPPGAMRVPGEDGFGIVFRPIITVVYKGGPRDGMKIIRHAEFLYVDVTLPVSA